SSEQIQDIPPDQQQKAEAIKEQGNVAFKSAEYDKAIELYTKAFETNPNNKAYLTNRAAALMSQKKFRSAIEDIENAISKDSNPSSKILVRLAKCHLALGRPTQALAVLTPVKDSDDSTVKQITAQSKRVIAAIDNYEKERNVKNWSMASMALRMAEREAGCSPLDIPSDWKAAKVECLIGKGDLIEAGRVASDILSGSPNSPDLLYLRARVLFLDSNFAKCIAHLQSAMRSDPDFTPAKKLLKRTRIVERGKEAGNVAFKSAQYEEAIEKYTEALSALSDDDQGEIGEGKVKAVLLSNRATTYSKMTDKSENALKDVDEALKLHPEYTKALRTRARIHLNIENFEESVSDFKKALEFCTMEEKPALENEVRNAEKELKKSKRVDHYKILSVHKEATEVELKKAFRKQSLVHHPDKGGNEEHFKQINESYSVLSDPQQRHIYDNGLDLDDGPGMGGGFSSGGFGGADINLADLFASGAFGGGMGGMGGGGFSSFGGSAGGFPGGGARFSSTQGGFPF
ncbi:TPR-like protein, partial [Wallemia mellicola]